MEKRKPHYDLEAIKAAVVRDGVASFTATARSGFKAMGLTERQALAAVTMLSAPMFYKSMTTHADHAVWQDVWQDVYHAHCPNGKTAYVKLTLQSGRAVIQFKEV